MSTISSFDLQVVPSDYDKPQYPFIDPLNENTVVFVLYHNGGKLTFPANTPDSIMIDIMHECWNLAQQRLNEYHSQKLTENSTF